MGNAPGPQGRETPANNALPDLVRLAVARGALGPADTSAFIIDMDALRARLKRLADSWPGFALHAVAVKANPLRKVLEFIQALGFGLEAASLGEVHLALNSGCPPERIVFDSPAKTVAELKFALDAGIRINADNFQEVERLAALLQGRAPLAPIGLRINPMVGAGSIKATSTATAESKFGVPLDAERRNLPGLFAAHPWLTALHAHVGSGGMNARHLTDSAAILFDLAEELNLALGESRIRILDLGGGLPVGEPDLPEPCPVEDFARQVLQARPGLAERYQVVTECGRWIHAPTGLAVSRVEYVKKSPGRNLAVIHLGADLLPRQCYQPGTWPLPVMALDARGRAKSGPARTWSLAGPLCFSGDLPFPSASLPDLEPGDLVAVPNAGAYTFSMFSHYNTRETPAMIGVSRGPGGPEFTLLKKRQTPENAAAFWDE